MKIKCLCTLSDGNVLNAGTVELPDELSGQKTYHFITNLSDGNFVDVTFTVPDHELPFYKGYHFRVTLSDGRVLETESFMLPYTPDIYDCQYHVGYEDSEGNIIINGIAFTYDESTNTASIVPKYSHSPEGDVVLDWISVYGTTYVLRTIPAQAFYYTTPATSFTLGNNVESVKQNAFYCVGGKSIYFGDNVSSLDDNSFRSNSDTASYYFKDWEHYWKAVGTSRTGHCFSIYSSATDNILYINDDSTLYIELPEGIDYIPPYAFSKITSSANKFIVPEGVTTLKKYCFDQTRNIYIRSSVLASIGSYVFNTFYTAYIFRIWTVMSEEQWDAIEKDSKWHGKLSPTFYMTYDWDGETI